ncbi:hypothetical protein [Steroidobacter denitrificans]|uniref:hypothetical protein n=1 Tax=Steroidobacter denitrificans TaxID=465721 RepID=UPI0012EE4D81|nr:hypothetical protein [Steroidobacter denitrificans]
MNRLTINTTDDQQHQALQELKTLLTGRIAQAGRGELVEDSITDIANEVLRHMRTP